MAGPESCVDDSIISCQGPPDRPVQATHHPPAPVTLALSSQFQREAPGIALISGSPDIHTLQSLELDSTADTALQRGVTLREHVAFHSWTEWVIQCNLQWAARHRSAANPRVPGDGSQSLPPDVRGPRQPLQYLRRAYRPDWQPGHWPSAGLPASAWSAPGGAPAPDSVCGCPDQCPGQAVSGPWENSARAAAAEHSSLAGTGHKWHVIIFTFKDSLNFLICCILIKWISILSFVNCEPFLRIMRSWVRRDS